jgi:hypothetical protein
MLMRLVDGYLPLKDGISGMPRERAKPTNNQKQLSHEIVDIYQHEVFH